MMYLKERERYQIEFYLKEGYKPKEIARKMNRHISTIYREIKRGSVELIDSNLKPYVKYCADTAQMKYKENCTAKGAPLKIGNDIAFANYIESKIINEKYSPQAALYAAHGFNTSVCFKTLYNYIDKGIFLSLKRRHLPHGKKQKIRRVMPLTTSRTAYKRSIEERCPDTIKRAYFGDWEMDTVYSKQGIKDCLLVLSERKTRQEIIIRMPDRTAASTVKAINELEKKHGANFPEIFRTITVDNGVEFSDSKGIEFSLSGARRTTLYYCHPYSSYERGTNENINKMIRRFIPKGTDIGKYSEQDIERIQNWINNYPRKIFGGLSSNEYLETIKDVPFPL